MLTAAEPPPAGGASVTRPDLLRAAGRTYSWQEVLAAAYFCGEAAELHAEVADAIAVLRYAEEEGFNLEEAGAADGENFRLEHNLITGEEMERWLGHCGIQLEEFESHFAARKILGRFSTRIGEIRGDYAPTAGEVVDAMWGAAILSGSFEMFVRSFARRVANRIVAPASAEPGEITASLRMGAPLVPGALATPGLLEELAALEALYAAAEREAASPERCAMELRERSYQLCRIVIAEAVFPSLDQANEAYQAVTADGIGLDEVAARAGIAVVETTLFADQTPEGATALLSAFPGRVLEPQQVESGFLLQLLRRRIEPDLADADVAARVRGQLLAAHFDALVSERIVREFDPWTVP